MDLVRICGDFTSLMVKCWWPYLPRLYVRHSDEVNILAITEVISNFKALFMGKDIVDGLFFCT